MLAQRLRGLWFKPLPRHPVVQVSFSLTSSSCCIYQHHATEARQIGVKCAAETTNNISPSFALKRVLLLLRCKKEFEKLKEKIENMRKHPAFKYLIKLLEELIVRGFIESFDDDDNSTGKNTVQQIISTTPYRYFVCLFYMQPLITQGQIIGAHGTDFSVGIRLLSGETLLQAKNSSGHRWGSNLGPCRQHDHCCKGAEPLRHQALE